MKITLNFPAVLGLLFITLKLTDVIDWSWWWVLLPFYGVFTLMLFFLFLYIILGGDEILTRRK